MPRNVRNFWIEGRIDGRESVLKGGPKNKAGGFQTVFLGEENLNRRGQ